MGKVLGVDLGAVRIGLAASDPSGTLATPLSVLTRSGDQTDDLQRIIDTAHEVGADRIVVGLPRSLDGSDGPAARAAREEIAVLERLAGDLPVSTHDERFTTVGAERRLAAVGVRRRERRSVVDAAAAAVMLQAWLEAPHE